MRLPSPPRSLRLCGRVFLLLLLFVAVSTRLAPVAHAQLSGNKSCTSTGGGFTGTLGETITCTLTLNASATDIPGAPTTININATGNNYTLSSATCTTTGGTGTCSVTTTSATAITAVCQTNPCTQIVFTETLVITALTPNTITQQISVSTPGVAPITVTDTIFRIVPPGLTFFVSTIGSDANNCETRATACATINRAHEVARDGDTIFVLAGTYTISRTVRVTKLVRIEPDGPIKVVLKADPGVTIFEVVAQGGPDQQGATSTRHVSIRNFTMGGNFKNGATDPVIRLLNDNYTEISGNIIGAEDLPINNGIVLINSDHPNITNNTIQGNTRFVFSPLLIVGKTTTGFGVVTTECFGNLLPDVSDSVTIANNIFTNMWIAGIWLCSDGAGKHTIRGNVFRNNWRGIALKDVTNTLVEDNTLIDGRNDGIILYGASLHNVLSKNHIESHIAADAAAIRVGWIADPIMPPDNRLEGNEIIRVTVGVHIFGARTTVLTNNQIKLSGTRTAILLTPSTTLGDPGTQPYDTEITGNTIIHIGACTPVIGCALRLLGVTVPVLARDNDWGLRRVRDVEGVIWHQYDDSVLGCVDFTPFRNMVIEPAATSPIPLCATATGPPNGVPPGGTPPAAGPTPGPSLTPTAMTGGGPVTSVPLPAGCTALAWPGASGVSVADMALGIMPAAAQRSAIIWRRNNGEWSGYSPASDGPSDVFILRRGDQLLVCVSQAGTWLIPTQVGGP